ncbi:hypothetical protein, partial [Erwinia sp. S59]|uniref:hypothetical protein n=1 Tax=Erwinia sp. S59 TaxID=2769340 RepID=UPI002573F371
HAGILFLNGAGFRVRVTLGKKLTSLLNVMTAVETVSLTANIRFNSDLSNFQTRKKSLLLKA